MPRAPEKYGEVGVEACRRGKEARYRVPETCGQDKLGRIGGKIVFWCYVAGTHHIGVDDLSSTCCAPLDESQENAEGAG